MSILQLHCSTMAVCPSENLPAVLSVPGHGGLRETSGSAGEGDILPYVSCHINWCFREQWADCGENSEFSFFVNFERSLSFGCTHCDLTSNLQTDSASSSSSRTAGHTAVLTSVDLLHPSNVQGPAVYILLNKRRGAYLKLTWGRTKRAQWSLAGHSHCHFCVYNVFVLNLPLNQWTRGGGKPVA